MPKSWLPGGSKKALLSDGQRKPSTFVSCAFWLAALLAGSVKSISEKQVVFSQDVNDPLSLIKQREIPKSVRPGGESME